MRSEGENITLGGSEKGGPEGCVPRGRTCWVRSASEALMRSLAVIVCKNGVRLAHRW